MTVVERALKMNDLEFQICATYPAMGATADAGGKGGGLSHEERALKLQKRSSRRVRYSFALHAE